MRTLIAYALIAALALAALFLVARLRRRKGFRPKKHLRIDLLAAKPDGAPQAAADTD
jgi:hypothetical protein